jgi:hypothetical protein
MTARGAGMTARATRFSLCQFAPEHDLNPDTLARYQQNRLRVVPELVYSLWVKAANSTSSSPSVFVGDPVAPMDGAIGNEQAGFPPKTCGNDGTGRGNDGTGRGNDGTGRGNDGTGRGNDGTGRGNDVTGRGNDGRNERCQKFRALYANDSEQRFLERVAAQLNKADPNTPTPSSPNTPAPSSPNTPAPSSPSVFVGDPASCKACPIRETNKLDSRQKHAGMTVMREVA